MSPSLKMHTHHHLFRPAPATFFFIVIAISTIVQFPVPSVHAVDDERYLNCSETFTCAGISGIGYPFWGSNRPEYCGYPDFELNCSGDVPLLNVTNMSYRVLEINSAERNLKVARVDYWDTICPSTYANTTVDSSPLFSHSTSSTTNLTLYYQCLSTSIGSVQTADGFSFACPGSDSAGRTNFYSSSEVAATINSLLGFCENNVKVPAETEATTLTSVDALREAIDGGFTLEWNANNSMCDRCEGSGGKCGFNTTTNAFACHCTTGSFTPTCESISDGKKDSTILGVGIGIGFAGLVGILLGLWIFFRQRKKKRAEEAKVKELPTTPSIKGVPDSSTNLSQSTPSYPHSKSDLEKGSTYFGAYIFSYAELEEATKNFERELGDGGFGTVYYGKLRDGRAVAVKRLYENNFKRVEQFMNEVIILTRLRHDNLVTLYGCTSKRSQGLLLVYEYISNGTVADHLNGSKSGTGSLTWPIRLKIAIESADALNFLHQSDVIHRDVKTNNILLDENFCVKVADFGLSRLFPTDVTHVSTAPQGTPGYVDPEYYQCYQLTNKSDVYSFGVVLIELISSLPAVDTNRHRHDINLASMAINKIQNHTLHELVDPALGFEKDQAVRRMTTSVAELAFRCLQQERDMRPTMAEVLEVLKRIKNEEMVEEKAEVVDIRVEGVGLLKNIPPPLSPDSVVTGKWISDSTTANSF